MRTEPELKSSMAFAMGGRAAEEIYYDGVVSTGAHNDLEKATETARAMVAVMGMSDDIGPISIGNDEQQWFAAPEGLAEDRRADRRGDPPLLEEAHARAYAILEEKKDLLGQLSALLIAVETIEGDDLLAYVKGEKPIPAPDALVARWMSARRQQRRPWSRRPPSSSTRRSPRPTSLPPRRCRRTDRSASLRHRHRLLVLVIVVMVVMVGLARQHEVPPVTEPVEEPIEVALGP